VPANLSANPQELAVARRHQVLYGLLVVGAVLRLTGLDAKCFWVDELHSLSVSHTFDQIMAYCRGGHTPPLRYLIVGALQPFPNAEFTVRLPAVVFGALTLPLMLWIGERLWNRQTGLVAAVLLLVSPWHLDHSQDARYYGLILFLALAALALAVEIVHEPRRLWRWIALAAACALNLYLSYVAVFSVMATGGYLAWCAGMAWRRRAQERDRAAAFLRGAAVAALVGFLALAPWLTEMSGLFDRYIGAGGSKTVAASQESAPTDPASMQPRIAWQTPFDRAYADEFLADLGLQQPVVKWALLAFFGVGLIGAVRRDRALGVLALLWFVFPWVVILNTGLRYFCPPRYLIHYLGLYLLFAAAGIMATWDRLRAAVVSRSDLSDGARIRRLALHLAAIMIALAALAAYVREDLRYYRTPKQDWRAVVHFLDKYAAPSDAVLTGGFWTPLGLLYYGSELSRPINLYGSCTTAPRIEHALALNPRAWYVTWGPLPDDVAHVLARRFDAVGAFHGLNGVIQVYRSK